MRSYSRGRGRGYQSRDGGMERAIQHIEEAEEFSREVGGTDRDVKAYFFKLSGIEKQEILRLYGQKYGAAKEDYARQTWYDWASGKRKMSGMVAKRLFSLLPNHMPIGAKLGLVESLWRHSSPSSHVTMTLDSRESIDVVLQKVEKYYENKLKHEIPANFTRRFDWLAGSDSQVKQQLLNHFRQLELSVVGESLQSKLTVLRQSLLVSSGSFISGSHTIKIGNHCLSLQFDNSAALAEQERLREQRRKLDEQKRRRERAEKVSKIIEEVKYSVGLALAILVGVVILWNVFEILTR